LTTGGGGGGGYTHFIQKIVEIQIFVEIKKQRRKKMQENIVRKIVRGLLIWFLWFIGSLIINHSSLKPQGWKSRTAGLIGWGILTFGIYVLVVAICQLIFEPKSSSNIGYIKE
jgi:hypothetical protein